MTLLELSEDLFEYICKLLRSTRFKGNLEIVVLRLEIQKIFTHMEKQANHENLTDRFDTLKRILIFFVDSLIAENNLSVSSEWNSKRLAYELTPPEYAGDQKFYELLNETMADHDPGSEDLLTVFYTCLGLGFVGHPTEEQGRIMQRISGRIINWQESGSSMHIAKQDYVVNDKDDLRGEDPRKRVFLVGTILVGLSVILILSNNFIFYWHTEDLQDALEKVLEWKE